MWDADVGGKWRGMELEKGGCVGVQGMGNCGSGVGLVGAAAFAFLARGVRHPQHIV